jgi:type IV pilus assembly protein PilN
MIRINLLAVGREQRTKQRRPAFTLGEAQKVTIGASVILALTALGIAWWFWSLQQQSARLDQDIVDAEAETRRLRGVLTQVQQFEARRAQLQQRVSLIEELRKGQSGPVHMLDSISKSLPDRLWLTEMTQTNSDLAVKGLSTSLTALSDFVANLEASGYFKKPVEIVDSQVAAAQASKSDIDELVRFEVKATFQAPQPPSASPGAPAAAPRR